MLDDFDDQSEDSHNKSLFTEYFTNEEKRKEIDGLNSDKPVPVTGEKGNGTLEVNRPRSTLSTHKEVKNMGIKKSRSASKKVKKEADSEEYMDETLNYRFPGSPSIVAVDKSK
jgi:hypothetical protein